MVADYKILTDNFNYETFKVFAFKYHFEQYGQLVQYAEVWKLNPHSYDAMIAVKDFTNVITTVRINEASVGASGSIFGILVAFGYLFPNMLIFLGFLFPIKAKWFVAGYFFVELFLAIQNNPGDDIAHAAHVGGGIVGFLIVYIWNKTNRKQFY